MRSNNIANNPFIRIGFGILFYVLLSAIQLHMQNPVLPGATIALSMIVPVLVGILFGRYSGALVGFGGTAIETFLSAGSEFALLAIIPHTIMGYLAGWLTDRYETIIGSLALLIGHILNISIYLLANALDLQVLTSTQFYIGFGFEIAAGIFGVNILHLMYEEMLYNFNYKSSRW